MEAEIAHSNSAAQWHTEGLNRAIEVLVIDRILIMPDTGGWICHFVADNPMPSFPGSGSNVLMVAPVQALIAGFVRTVAPTAAK